MKNAHSVIPLLATPAVLSGIGTDARLGSPLQYAAAKGEADACKLLLRRGNDMDVNLLNDKRETPLYRACCGYPESVETVQVLLDNGADPFVRSKVDKTARDEAEARKYFECVRIIDEAIESKGKAKRR